MYRAVWDENTNQENPKVSLKKTQSKNKKLTEKKSKNIKNVKSKGSPKQIMLEEKIGLETQTNKSKIREIKSSQPIEVTQIDEKSNIEKPKKKGWWSK